jgi:hypothetical protein
MEAAVAIACATYGWTIEYAWSLSRRQFGEAVKEAGIVGGWLAGGKYERPKKIDPNPLDDEVASSAIGAGFARMIKKAKGKRRG